MYAVQDSHVQLVHLFVELLAEAGHLAADESQVGLGVGQLALQGAILRLDVLQSLPEAGQLSLLFFIKLIQSFLQNTALHTSIAALRQTCSVLPAKHSITQVYCCSSSNLFRPSCKTQHYTSLLLLLVKLVQAFLQNTQHYTRLLPPLVKGVQSFLQNTALIKQSIVAPCQTCSVVPANCIKQSIAFPGQTCSVLPAKHNITHVYCYSCSNLFSPSCKHYIKIVPKK